MFEMYGDYLARRGLTCTISTASCCRSWIIIAEYNSLSHRDYYALEGLMWRLNAKVRESSFNLGGCSRVSHAFRKALLQHSSTIPRYGRSDATLDSVEDTRNFLHFLRGLHESVRKLLELLDLPTYLTGLTLLNQFYTAIGAIPARVFLVP